MRLRFIPILLVSAVLIIASFTYSQCLAITKEKLNESKNECITTDESKGCNIKNDDKKVLIVYEPGLGETDGVVERLRKKIGANLFKVEEDLFESEVENNYFNIKSESNLEYKINKEKLLKNGLPNVSSYDLILVVSPVMWKDSLSIPVMSFLAKTDFSDKEVVLLSVAEEGDEEVFNEFCKQAQNATILKGLNLKNLEQINEVELDEKINSWLEQLNI